MGTIFSRRITGVLFFVIISALSLSASAQAGRYVNENQALIQQFQTWFAAARPETAPQEVQNEWQKLRQAGIPIFMTNIDLASTTSPQHVIVQEFLRSQIDWGLPWLPLSWYNEYHNIEEENLVIARGIENVLKNLTPMSNEGLLIGYLYNSSVIHTGRTDIVNQMRSLAHNLYSADNNFYAIRMEIHNQPNLTTLAKLDKYIATTPSVDFRNTAMVVRGYLQDFFGNSSLETYLSSFVIPTNYRTTLTTAQKLAADLLTTNSARDIKSQLDSIFDTLNLLGDQTLEISDILRRGVSTCTFSTNVDCAYEYFDLLKQYQTILLALGGNLQQQIVKHQIEISPKDFVTYVGALAASSASIGLIDKSVMNEVQKFEKKSAKEVINPSELQVLVSKVEAQMAKMPIVVKGVLGSTYNKYTDYVPTAEKIVDDVIRRTTVLPLSYALSSMLQTLQAMSGIKVELGNKKIMTSFRVLNPGLAHGVLKFATEEQLTSDKAAWDPEAVYVLPKTPATLQKVAGIITADSGSMISHVQLLAGNHGLPNLYVTESFLELVKAYEGKDIMLITLPNGESRIKLWSEASAQEKASYNEYMNFKDKQRVTLPRPTGLDVKTPLYLEQLRRSDMGRLAGGKACGQGELASLFPNTVPKALVLPFGVYADHATRHGIIDFVQKIFTDPAFKGTDEKARNLKAKKLEEIRKKIKSIKMDKTIVAAIAKFVSRPEFADKGFFVRSDTNAEDLDQFVGAGLNDTVPDVHGINNIVEAVKHVWSSPFTDKAISWRSDLIANPWEIFPSVIIQVGVSSSKAGVMIAGDPTTGEATDTVFVAANEGVGITVVNGEFSPEESTYSRKDKNIQRLRRAYATTRKVLTKNGLQERPTIGTYPLITDKELAELAGYADKFQKHMAKIDGDIKLWDFEYGVVNGKVILFQVRKFIGNKIIKNIPSLLQLQSKESENVKPVEIGFTDRSLVYLQDKKNN